VTAHDGFTLRDLVSYNEKHNEANGEDGNDGESHNRSWNSRRRRPDRRPDIVALRKRQQRNLVTTLLLSQGVPMLLGGDELGRTQGGNNNAYCQDNEISWFDWRRSLPPRLHAGTPWREGVGRQFHTAIQRPHRGGNLHRAQGSRRVRVASAARHFPRDDVYRSARTG
jgi:pullulanase/glycogen debranching enzyme